MSRKILLAALLCLSLGSLCHAQTHYWPTMGKAIQKRYNGSTFGYNTALRYIDIYHTIASPVNSETNRTVKYFVVWTICVVTGQTYPSGTVSVSEYAFVVEQHPDGYVAQ
jgi:hypothetical protein